MTVSYEVLKTWKWATSPNSPPGSRIPESEIHTVGVWEHFKKNITLKLQLDLLQSRPSSVWLTPCSCYPLAIP